jgi:hypothetical protein
VVEQDDPVAEAAGLGQAQVGAGVDGLEQGLAPADGDRVDVDAVLVDQVVAAEGGRQIGPAQGEVAVGPGRQAPDLLGVDLGDDGGVPVGPLRKAPIAPRTSLKCWWTSSSTRCQEMSRSGPSMKPSADTDIMRTMLPMWFPPLSGCWSITP